MISQIRRTAVSVAANIVEGAKRNSDKDFALFLNMSEGSLKEIKYYLILSKDLNYISKHERIKLMNMSEEAGKLLRGFIKKLKA